MREDPFFLVRIAGLPGEAMDEFGSPGCMAALANCRRLQAALTEARGRLVDALYALAPQAPPELRRRLLAIKRDAFNGRSLARHAQAEAAGEDLQRVLDAERALAEAEAHAEALYAKAESDERAALARHLENRKIVRGITLASRDLIDGLRIQKKPRADRSLLRYISRAALKLSPFSTLTRIGVGTVREGEATAFRLIGKDWEERSLFRAKRYLLDQYRSVLFRVPSVRRELEVELNDTLEETSPGQFRMLRPTLLVRDEDTGELQYSGTSLVRAQLGGPLIKFLLDELKSPMKYSDLLEILTSELSPGAAPVAPQVEATVEKLLDLGFLKIVPPWPSHEIHLERRMADFLARFPGDDGLAAVRASLLRLLELEGGYAAADQPGETVRLLDEAVEQVWERLAPVGIPDAQLGFKQAKNWNYYEDVMLRPASQDAIFHLSSRAANEILRSADALWRISSVYQSRYEFQHTLAAFARNRWPRRDEIGFLDLFAEAQPLWKQYISSRDESRKTGFNPYGIPEITELRALRAPIQEHLRKASFLDDSGCHIPLGAAEEVLSWLPTAYDPIVRSCVFVQPADSSGSTWMLNRLFEGTGRFGARFTASMDDRLRQEYVAQFTEGARLLDAEVLDLMFSQGNTVNVHWPQTPRVLEVPGECAKLPAGRRLSPKALRVRLDAAGGLPTIVDGEGKRLLPCHLSALNSLYTPVLLKFLAIFGPSTDAGPAIPAPEERTVGALTLWDRITFGNLIARRRRWLVPSEAFPGRGLQGFEAYRTIDSWRQEHGLPSEVFLIERTEVEGVERKFWKPQYLDFTSPTFLAILAAGTRKPEPRLVFEEVLPSRDLYPADAGGRRWGVELLLDGLVMPRRADMQPGPEAILAGGMAEMSS